MVRGKQLGVLVAACLATAAVPRPVAAHAGLIEVLTRVAIDPEHPSSLAVRVDSRGGALLLSDDGGASLRMLCGAVAAPGTVQSMALARLPGGAILLGGGDGLSTLDSAGCGAVREPLFEGLHVADLSAEQGAPGRIYAVTDTPGAQNLLARSEQGGPFVQVGAATDAGRTRVRVVPLPGGGERIYETLVDGTYVRITDQGEQEIPRCSLRHSDDGGTSWQTHDCPLTPGTLTLEAVDPGEPDRLFVAAYRGDQPGALFVSHDRGASFTQYMELFELGGMEFLDDGRVLLGDGGSQLTPGSGGLWLSHGWDAPPERLASYPVLCLARPPGGAPLYACQRFNLGTVDLDDGEFHVLSGLQGLGEQVQCPGTDTAQACEVQLCRGYCKPGYFAQAPVCGAYYESPTCGPCADDPESDGCRAAQQAAGAPGADAGPDAGSAADAGADTHGSQDDAGGCGVVRVGSAGAPSAGPCALLAGLCALVRRRGHRRASR